MKTIVYSDDKTLYYIKELALCGFCNWVSVEKFNELPEQHPMKLDYAVQYDNSYFRKIFPFNFWKVRSYMKIEKQVEDDHELVKDYIQCDRHERK